jgi:YidC/Oxa1 family membrane protein insertase
MTDQKNTLLAIVLSAIVLIGWQYFIGMPQMEKQRQQQQAQQQAQEQLSAGERGAQQDRSESRPRSWVRAADTGEGRPAAIHPTGSTSPGVDVRV